MTDRIPHETLVAWAHEYRFNRFPIEGRFIPFNPEIEICKEPDMWEQKFNDFKREMIKLGELLKQWGVK